MCKSTLIQVRGLLLPPLYFIFFIFISSTVQLGEFVINLSLSLSLSLSRILYSEIRERERERESGE